MTSRNKRRRSKFEDRAEHSAERCAPKLECRQHKRRPWYVRLKITGWKAVCKTAVILPSTLPAIFHAQSSSAGRNINKSPGRKKKKKINQSGAFRCFLSTGEPCVIPGGPTQVQTQSFPSSCELLENRFRHIFSTCSSR